MARKRGARSAQWDNMPPPKTRVRPTIFTSEQMAEIAVRHVKRIAGYARELGAVKPCTGSTDGDVAPRKLGRKRHPLDQEFETVGCVFSHCKGRFRNGGELIRHLFLVHWDVADYTSSSRR